MCICFSSFGSKLVWILAKELECVLLLEVEETCQRKFLGGYHLMIWSNYVMGQWVCDLVIKLTSPVRSDKINQPRVLNLGECNELMWFQVIFNRSRSFNEFGYVISGLNLVFTCFYTKILLREFHQFWIEKFIIFLSFTHIWYVEWYWFFTSVLKIYFKLVYPIFSSSKTAQISLKPLKF